MRHKQVGILVAVGVWLTSALLSAWGMDHAMFQALQLVRLPQPVELPAVKLLDTEGKPVPLQSFHGNVVFLNFWTTW